MSMLLRLSTAANITMGPFLDSTDGDSEETALTVAQADIRLSKNGGAYAQTNNAVGATHQEKGNYQVPLNTIDANTLGRLRVYIHVAGALAVWQDFIVVPANVYDSFVAGTDTLQADMTELGGVAQSAADLKDFADAGYDPATNKVEGVKLVDANTDMRGTDGANTTTPLSAAQVNAEMVDVLKTDTLPELAQAVPPATPTLAQAVMLLYMALRNKVDVTATLKEVHNDAGAVIAKKSLSDNGTTYSEAEMVSGP